ncbi:unnamed protein product [Hapterophycus canaliculatus]
MFRIFDPYATALCLLVGGVGFGMTYFFNTNVAEWGAEEIVYPTMAMIYVYARNARFFESDEESATKILEGHGDATADSANDAADSKGGSGGASGGTGREDVEQKVRVPAAVVGRGAVSVTGPPRVAAEDGSLSVVFFFATWCVTCEKVMPAILSVAARYGDEGIRFTGVTQEGEEDLRYFVETYQRSLRSVTLLADEKGVLTEGYQGAHNTKTIPHCYIVREDKSRGAGANGSGMVEWHGHPARLEAALGYIMDEDEDRRESESGSGAKQVPVAVPVEG